MMVRVGGSQSIIRLLVPYLLEMILILMIMVMMAPCDCLLPRTLKNYSGHCNHVRKTIQSVGVTRHTYLPALLLADAVHGDNLFVNRDCLYYHYINAIVLSEAFLIHLPV
jgi:hypothetical protein